MYNSLNVNTIQCGGELSTSDPKSLCFLSLSSQQLVGSTDVSSARGDAMCADAIKKLKVD